MDASVPVLVLKPNRGLVQHGVLGIARSLGRMGVSVYWAHGDFAAPAATSRYLSGSFHWAIDHSRPDERLARLIAIGRKLGRQSILIPTDDGTSVLVAEHADALRDHFIFPTQSPEVARRLANKREMHDLCLEQGVPAPWTIFPESRDDVLDFAEQAEFPVVLKRAEGWLPQRGARKSVVIVDSAAELLRAYDEMESPIAPNTLIQDYIPGSSDSIWMFNGYFDDSSDCLFAATGQKIRQHPPNTGPTTLGVCVHNDTVTRMTRNLMKAIGYRGILDIGFRYDARDGEFKLLDANPRIGSSFRLFVGADGMDVVRALYLDLTGHTLPSGLQPTSKRKWMDEPLDVVSAVRHFRDGDLTIRGWLRSFAGVSETAWFARDDPMPSVAVWLRYGLVALRKLGMARETARAPVGVRDQEIVNAHFDAASRYWEEIYADSSVYGLTHQERRLRALDWVGGLTLPGDARVLEVGCGAGLAAVALAARGFEVDATDPVPSMLERARERAEAGGVSGKLRVHPMDVHALDFEDETFDLALALGVVPWLHSPLDGLRELVRVLKPQGYLVVSADNRIRLTHLLDPRTNPWLASSRQAAKEAFSRLGVPHPSRGSTPPSNVHSPSEFDFLLDAAGFETVSSQTLGFGPFTFWNHELLPGHAVGFHRRLQRYADKGIPLLRSGGTQYLVLARKRGPAAPSADQLAEAGSSAAPSRSART
jgi:D-aspartate ligase